MKLRFLTILSTSTLLGCASQAVIVDWQTLPQADLQKVCNAYGTLNYKLAGCAYSQRDKCFVYTSEQLVSGSAEEQMTVGHEIVAHCFKKHSHKEKESLQQLIKEVEKSSTGK